ncbi:polymer-forming cytoskeletal protein [Pelagibius sp. Alg239-R121]|uniref:bactofilin family protein n=1 Tax=Pelagibius sp. Alg239-R121 TaxID=2993448 RepID=UPI0024A75101|nr:polymer-forming cytoskeletal protein [Pelagibius sp. Alg239-R121]
MFSKSNKSNTEATKSDDAGQQAGSTRDSGVPSIISADLTIVGNLTSSGDLQVDGTVEGDISSRTLTIGEKAQVRGSVLADSVRVCGSINGQLQAASVVLAKSARVTGDISHSTLAIEAGAFIEGNIRRLEDKAVGFSASSAAKTSAPAADPTVAAAAAAHMQTSASAQTNGSATKQ